MVGCRPTARPSDPPPGRHGASLASRTRLASSTCCATTSIERQSVTQYGPRFTRQHSPTRPGEGHLDGDGLDPPAVQSDHRVHDRDPMSTGRRESYARCSGAAG